MIEDILKLQQTLIDLSLRREEVRQCTKTLTEKNTVLKDYIDNLILK